MTDVLPMVEDVEDDPDLEPDPWGPRPHRTITAWDRRHDLDSGRHLLRNLLEDYAYLASCGLWHEQILSRLNLSALQWRRAYERARQIGLPVFVNRQPTNDESEEAWTWKCGKRVCGRCGGSR